MKVIVASKNPVKVSTTQEAFMKVFPDVLFEVEGVSTDSNVSDQPMSEEETLQGALNRVNYAQTQSPDGAYWVGIEGGLKDVDGHLEAFAWIVIKGEANKIGKGRTGSFYLPQKVAALISQGKELGEADDIVFGLSNSKQANGAVGILTGDVLTRSSFYEPAVILALIPFINRELY
jgi:inosine/xanthosine triphosphatase